MPILNQIKTDFQQALKRRQTLKVATLRMLMAALNDERSALYGSQDKQLADEQTVVIIRRETKKRREAIALYNQGKRPELAAKEAQEIKFLEQYLPAQMPESEVTKITQRVIAQLGAQGPAVFGKVMGVVMGQLNGQADGKQVAETVKRSLNTTNFK
ncbi:glutamyl-tRNA amidotransferase [Candidatus Shapirobacteria bacterium CG09_land_8_20_14_0_10_49_15]|uniref:Glutamyl-tRNA amidotransferase n=2 Tax=Candidatus Shapironibacteriota TaxID=1752721 RepID=A0A2M8L804_9BACT|nr:MAG: glutamyl-tRNA amidotransferase [Candidatus Shapirobacteria bacterium CG09_land_8_20_14_0_10_49_15]PJE70332.1 MAG: glutamyl-tRNA amidotransferase [Candidatus Shapirobacteria bacterium CG10_big_fil_rev_8_21_14_0_10_48_15]